MIYFYHYNDAIEGKMKKEEFTILLEQLGISQKNFADIASISYNTVSNWNDTTKPVPSWVDSWLQNYAKAKHLDLIAETIKPYISTN